MDKAIVDPRTVEGFEDLSHAEQISLLKEYSSSVKEEILKVTAQHPATEKLRNDLAYQKARADLLQEGSGIGSRTPVRKGAFGYRDVFTSEAAETPLFGKPTQIHNTNLFGFSSESTAHGIGFSTPTPAPAPAPRSTSPDSSLGFGSGSGFGAFASGSGTTQRDDFFLNQLNDPLYYSICASF